MARSRGTTGGRTTRMPNSPTAEVQDLAAAILRDPTYQKTLRARARRGELPPALEAMLADIPLDALGDDERPAVGEAGARRVPTPTVSLSPRDS